jgi:exodeoxyribonuclease V beta subunit
MTGSPNATEFDPIGDLSSRAILVEASAGTGKTHSITNVFLRLVVRPEDFQRHTGERRIQPREILVVTFTEAATADMRERIRTRLRTAREGFDRALSGEAISPDKDPVLHFLVQQALDDTDGLIRCRNRVEGALQSFDEITISTIHGFCQRMLLRNAFESGTEFDCELAADLGPLVEDAILDFWVSSTHDLGPDLLGLVQGPLLGGVAGVRRIARVMVSNPDLRERIRPDTWPRFEPGAWDLWKREVSALRDVWDVQGPGAVAELHRLRGLGIISGDFRPNWLDSRSGKVDGAWFPGDNADYLKYFTSDAVRKALKPGASTDLPWSLFEAVDRVHGSMASAMQCAHSFLMDFRADLVGRVLDAVEDRKARSHTQGFEDLLRRLRDGLDPRRASSDALRRAIAGQYRVAIIDEFQDTDPVQWAIFERVFLDGARGRLDGEVGRPDGSGGRLFLVGDPKQAIYAFRGADLDTYIEARQHTEQRTLSRNWRSDGRLVEAMNCLYRAEALANGGDDGAPFLRPGEVDYIPVTVPDHHRDDRWTYPADWSRAPLRIGLLDRGGSDKTINKGDARRWIAQWVAADIASFLSRDAGATVRDHPEKPGMRPVLPRDIAVLAKSHRQGRAIERALRSQGVPCVRRGQESVFETEEATHLKAFLEALLAPRDRNALRTALATSVAGLTADRIQALEGDDTALEEHLGRFAAWVETWRSHGFMRMIRDVFDATDVTGRFLALADGERRLTNLLHLAELLHDAAKRQTLKPEGLATWYRRQLSGAVSDGDPDARLLRLESDADAVQIVTVHGSKGLQYPFVWCPFLWDGFIMHPDEAAIPRFHDDDGRMSIDLAPEGDDHDGRVALARAERLAEMQRLAYVAMTRARYSCTLVTGAIRDMETSPMAVLMHQERDVDPAAGPEARLASLKNRLGKVADGTLADDLEAIATASQVAPGDSKTRSIDWFRIMPPPYNVPFYRPSREGRIAREDLAAEEWIAGRALDPAWRDSSYSSMTRMARARKHAEEIAAPEPQDPVQAHETRQDLAGPDEDDVAGVIGSGPPESESDPGATARLGEVVPLDAYPRGAAAGEYMHGVFEDLVRQRGFADVDRQFVADVVQERRAFHGLDRQWGPPFIDAVDCVLDTPLGSTIGGGVAAGPRLRDLARGDCLAELEFHLPAMGGLDARPGGGTVAPGALARAFAAGPQDGLPPGYAQSIGQLGFPAFRGFLTGIIDLVFRWSPTGSSDDARWYILDYKSNRLVGSRTAGHSLYGDYLPGRMAQAMAAHDYVLQYHLYAVALHRFLAARLGPAYSYETHFGGVYYLFLRGMQGGAPRADTGVFRDRPPAERIEALSNCFRED